MEQTGSSAIASPIRSPPPEPPADAQAPPPPLPPPKLLAVDPSPLSSDKPTSSPPFLNPNAPSTIIAPPPDATGDSFPPSPPSPPKTPAPPPLPTTDRSPPHPTGNQAPAPPPPSPPPPPPPPAPATIPQSQPAPASKEAKSHQAADEAPGESENMTLALVPTQSEEVMPPTPQKEAVVAESPAGSPQKEAVVAESPAGSPQKESALTVAKLLSAEDHAAKEAKMAADKVAPAVVTESVAGAGGDGGRGGVGSKRWLLRGVPEKVRRTELKRAELGFRVSAAVFCLVSLSVMSAGTTPGWAGDTFRRYNEYRYTLAASVMAFIYSVFQLVAEVHYLVTGRPIIGDPWGNYFNLAMDQILAYLLLSASSAALSRNDVWVSRFGVDQFAKLINASASMAFLAFIALGLSSIISAYRFFRSVS